MEPFEANRVRALGVSAMVVPALVFVVTVLHPQIVPSNAARQLEVVATHRIAWAAGCIAYFLANVWLVLVWLVSSGWLEVPGAGP